jgi:hypothetical protein
MLESAPDQRFGKKSHGGFIRGEGRQLGMLTPGGRALFFGDRRGSLRIPKLVERRLKILRRIQIMLK